MSDAIWIRLIDQLPQILGTVVAGLAAYFSYKATIQGKKNAVKIDEVQAGVNGKMEQLLEVTKAASKAEGKLEEKGEQGIRDGNNSPAVLTVDDVVKVELVNPPEEK